MNITHEERVKFLKAYNDLRNTLQNIHECQDIWLSDVGKLEYLEYLIRRNMEFVPQQDEDGNTQWWNDYILAEEDDD